MVNSLEASVIMFVVIFLFLLLKGHIQSMTYLKIDRVLVLRVRINPFVMGFEEDLSEYITSSTVW